MGYLKVATREEEKYYPWALANSVHFYYSEDKEHWVPFNQNYGILFAKATIREDNTIEEQAITNPVFVKTDKGYGITARIIDREGTLKDAETVLLWNTEDFLHFEEQEKVSCKTCEVLGDVLEVPGEMGKILVTAWTPIHCVSVDYEKEFAVNTLEDLDSVRATVNYNDGTKDIKRIVWDKKGAVKEPDGVYKVKGEIYQKQFPFPRAVGYADPVIFRYDGKWYYVATNDNLNDIGIYVREAAELEWLFAEDVKQHCILDYDEEKNYIQTFWAPEFHMIGGDVYLLFALGGKQWAPHCHMMKLKKGGSIIKKEDWEEPVRVVRQDGSSLSGDGITLDMTYFKANNQSYVAWSYRYGIGTSKDTGSMIYIATIDEKEPWRLTGEPVLLSRPLYGWENLIGTINNEGPYMLQVEDRLYLAYSGGHAGGYYYSIGYLMAKENDDLLNPDSWKKLCTPAMSYYSIENVYGPGHNSFFKDEEGKLWNAHHGEVSIEGGPRSTALNRVHVNQWGFPVLNMSPERELCKEMKQVEARVTIKES